MTGRTRDQELTNMSYPPDEHQTPPVAGPYPPAPGTYPPPGVDQPAPGPWPAGPGPAAPPPPKKSGVAKIVLIVLAVLLVLCAGGATAIWFAFKDEVTETVDASRTRLVAPDTLAGRPKRSDPQLQQAADEMVREIQATVQNETSAVGAFYGDPAQEDLVMIVGASGLMSDPKQELDEAVAGLSAQLALTDMSPVEPGPLGGEARCGDGRQESLPLGICVWADRGSVGTVVMFFSSRADVAAEFVTMRGQIQQRE
ncbi:hypothetical protein [Micromonospora sp. LOL_024]|uniref:hypothetical protein n=1 Tax=Micromonospora sp. LOL_024 TaxID=3345412 RepID=UPI003A8C0E38